MGKFIREPVQQIAAIFCTLGASLFVINDVLANIPVSLDQNGIDGCGNLGAGRVEQDADALYKRVITGICRYSSMDKRYFRSIYKDNLKSS